MSRLPLNPIALAWPHSLFCFGRALFVLALIAIFLPVSLAEAQNQFQGGYPQAASAYPPAQVPSSVWSVTSPVIPDRTPQGEIVDHTSMSPDSWSAPIPVPPNNGFPNSRFPAATFKNSMSQSLQENAFDPNSFQTNRASTPSPSQTPSSNDNQLIDNGLPKAPQIPQLAGPKDTRQSQPASPFRPSNFSVGSTSSSNGFSLPNTSGDSSNINMNHDSQRYPLGQSLGAERDAQSESNLPRQSTLPRVNSMPDQSTEESFGQISPANPILTAGGNQNSGSEHNQNHLSVGTPYSEPSPTPSFFQPRQSTAGAHSMFGVVPNYRPDLGHRDYAATVRNRGSWDNGEKFDFEEKKKEYPPMSEILATGRYFGSLSMLYLRPAFQNNTAITSNSSTLSQSIPFDFDYEVAPQFQFGFESKYGPGFELKYMQYDETSNVASFTSNGVVSGETSTWMMGPSRWTRLIAANPGDTLQSSHSIDVESISMMVFKELKFPISRLNGSFGMQYVSIAQSLDATVTNGGALVGSLNSRSDMRAYGPRFMFEYYRPVGHTKLEFVTSFGGSVMFGRRDQFVQNLSTNDFSRLGADEFVTTTEFYTGAQYKKNFAENRSVFARVGFQYQAWHGGGTAVDAQDDFGLRGFSIGVGYNR